jgi:hypothetical protein
MNSHKTLYKYRGLEPWDYLLDILVNKRLYAAKFTSLNDPMEGMFTYSEDTASPSFIEQMMDHKTQFGICSLSEVHNSTLMWSYYASSHRGIVLGLEVPCDSSNISVEKVAYCQENNFVGFLGSDVTTETRKILSKKLTPWKHEREVRAFTRGDFVPVVLNTAYFGCRMPEPRKTLLRALLSKLTPEVEIKELTRDDLDRGLPDQAI